MKKILKNTGLFIFILFSCSASAQNSERAVTAFAGNAQLKNGICTIELPQPMNVAEYYVSITPLAECKMLYVTKENSLFKVTEAKGEKTSDVSFDYIIYKKRPAPAQPVQSDAVQPESK